jgi:epoxyqueuosine reductase
VEKQEHEEIGAILRASGFSAWGVAGFENLWSRLIDCAARKRLPERAASVITALFPYYSGDHRGANLSKYAMPRDYHIVVGKILATAQQNLAQAFPLYQFAAFCDASPMPEVEAARLAGLGVVGRNGLLISPEYGSFVFIGEIVTDMKLEPNECKNSGCSDCMACVKNCPTGAIHGAGIDKSRCLSAITQKKGRLTGEEEALIKRAGSIWGCDVCQNVCPMNTGVKQTCIEAFQTDLVTHIGSAEISDADFVSKNRDRAFMWKGKAVLERNICIIESIPEDNSIKI